MTVMLLTEHHLGFLSLKGGCTGSSECTLVKMPHCWKSHAAAHILVSMGNRDAKDTPVVVGVTVGVPVFVILIVILYKG